MNETVNGQWKDHKYYRFENYSKFWFLNENDKREKNINTIIK